MRERILFVFSLYLLFSLFPFLAHPKEQKIRFGALPILDVLPVYVAEEKGFFKEHSVNLEVIPCASASERDQLLISGNIDVTVNDLVSLALINKDRINVKGVRYAMVPTQRFFQFAIVSSKDSKILSVNDLKGIPIGISYATIIHYVTEGILKNEGLKKEDIKILSITRIPDRLSALLRGDLKAACLPEPFASFAVFQKANLVIDDRKYPELSGSIYSSSKSLIDKDPEALMRFFLAIDKAISEIRRDKSICDRIITQKKIIPSALSSSYTIPDFPDEKIPDERSWKSVVNWLNEKGLIKKKVQYSESIMRIRTRK